MIVAALALAYLGRTDDLVEARRRFRLLFVGVSGVYSVIIVATEIYFRAQPAALVLEFLNIGVIFLVIFSFSVAMTQLRPALLPAVSGRVRTVSDAPPSDVDASLLEALRSQMAAHHSYRQNGLSIGKLADQPGAQEYRVRRLINGTLGFRNFNEFLNA